MKKEYRIRYMMRIDGELETKLQNVAGEGMTLKAAKQFAADRAKEWDARVLDVVRAESVLL